MFCGARSGERAGITEAAREVGRLIGERGHRLVYGGGGSGLMGEVAWAAAKSGAPITGYTPRFLYERELAIAAPDQELHLTDDMFERKRLMIEHADAFLALPGGYGTLDEVLDVLSLNCLGEQGKPLVLVDAEGFWGPIRAAVEKLRGLGFADHGEGVLFRTARGGAEALALAEALATGART
ncbi:TIGR00730 family Rossman fold protein [Kitasatospora sp. NPDC052896]|uniref:TIGR00730 family Rossman fold protein n=1 Tax=Kitasatospora sp. NPDC052896 TaxID=3364061 RepID=UPI0037C7335F